MHTILICTQISMFFEHWVWPCGKCVQSSYLWKDWHLSWMISSFELWFPPENDGLERKQLYSLPRLMGGSDCSCKINGDVTRHWPCVSVLREKWRKCSRRKWKSPVDTKNETNFDLLPDFLQTSFQNKLY